MWLATGGAPLGAAQYAAVVAAALAMGLQSAAFRLVPVPGVTTTYFTGTLTSLLVGLVTAGRLNAAALSALLALPAGAVVCDRDGVETSWPERGPFVAAPRGIAAELRSLLA